MARALLSGGGDINARTAGGVTPTQIALSRMDAGAEALLGLFTFWAADVRAAQEARLRSGGQGCHLLAPRSLRNGGALSAHGGSAHAGSTHSGCRSQEQSEREASQGGGSVSRSVRLAKQHGSCAALHALAQTDSAKVCPTPGTVPR